MKKKTRFYFNIQRIVRVSVYKYCTLWYYLISRVLKTKQDGNRKFWKPCHAHTTYLFRKIRRYEEQIIITLASLRDAIKSSNSRVAGEADGPKKVRCILRSTVILVFPSVVSSLSIIQNKYHYKALALSSSSDLEIVMVR